MTRIDRIPKMDPPPRRRKRWLLLLPLVLLLVWWLWPDGKLAKARDSQSQLFAEGGQLSPEDRRAKFEELRNRDPRHVRLAAPPAGRGHAKTPRGRSAAIHRHCRRPRSSSGSTATSSGRSSGGSRCRTTPTAAPPGGFGGGPGGPNGPGRPTTPEDRERRRQERLDHTTPEFREMTDQYRRDMADRRKQLGLPPPPGRPGR